MSDDEKVDATRRRLLKLAVYTPPAILGALSLLPMCGVQRVVCDPDSCAPTLCVPILTCAPSAACLPDTCHPVIKPCSPMTCNPSACNPIG